MCEEIRHLVCEYAHEHISYTTQLYGNMSVELKHLKLCNKLHTDTPIYVIIYTRTRPCKSTICVEARLFTVNKSNIPSH